MDYQRFSVMFSILLVSILIRNVVKCDQLVMVQAMWRHGDRSAIKFFPKDPANSESSWPQGEGYLSMFGMQQHYALGQKLAQRYKTFLGLPEFHQEKIHIRSTDVNRTLMSALSNLAGMYHGIANSKYNGIPSIQGWPSMWLPIPVHTMIRQNDIVNIDCKAASDYYDTVTTKLPAYQKYVTDNQDFYDQLSNLTGRTIDFDFMYWFHDTLFCEQVHNATHKWPSWVTPTIFQRAKALATANNAFAYSGLPRSRLKGGIILRDLLRRFQHKISCVGSSSHECKKINNLKYFAYSAHDSSVMKIMAAMGTTSVMPRNCPDYAGTILWELWHMTDGAYHIKTYYKNGWNVTEFSTMKVDGCASYDCPFATFYNRSIPYLPVDFAKECASKQWAPPTTGSTNPPPSSPTPSTSSHQAPLCNAASLQNAVIALGIICGLLAMALIALGYLYWRSQRKTS